MMAHGREQLAELLAPQPTCTVGYKYAKAKMEWKSTTTMDFKMDLAGGWMGGGAKGNLPQALGVKRVGKYMVWLL